MPAVLLRLQFDFQVATGRDFFIVLPQQQHLFFFLCAQILLMQLQLRRCLLGDFLAYLHRTTFVLAAFVGLHGQ